ncbi:three component ABC system middle component [Nocardioides plantarum]|uniref:Three component ABC system middle component n=1 Tax=Nocardioides plantarum TaxID=29299 RepID=A0ABV5KGG5_9ACTN
MSNSPGESLSTIPVAPPSEWSLFNPAFIAVLLRQASDGWFKTTETGMHFSYGFLVLPLVLHGPSRRELPKSTARALVAWIYENPALVETFPRNAKALSPYIAQGTLYGCATGLIVSDGGLLYPGSARRRPSGLTSEVLECFSKSAQVGRWLARQATPELTFGYLGVSP